MHLQSRSVTLGTPSITRDGKKVEEKEVTGTIPDEIEIRDCL